MAFKYETETLKFIQDHADELADIVDGKSEESLYDFVMEKIRSTSDRPNFAQIVYFLVEEQGCDLGWTETLKVVGSMESFGWCYHDKIEVGNLVWPQEGPIVVPTYTFRRVDSITSLHINKSDFDSIGQEAFQGCRNLKSVKLDSCKGRIGYRAFAGCESLQEVILPDGLDALCEACFVDCPIKVLELPQSIRWIEKNIIGVDKGSYIGAGKTKIKIRGMNKEEGREFLNYKVCFETSSIKARILSKVI